MPAQEAKSPPAQHVARLAVGADRGVEVLGAIEQPNPAGVQFGFEAVLASIAKGGEPAAVTRTLIADVRAHAQGDSADDLTVATMRPGEG